VFLPNKHRTDATVRRAEAASNHHPRERRQSLFLLGNGKPTFI
jgi:hypothetical protein